MTEPSASDALLLRRLMALGAQSTPHLDGDLHQHLVGTWALLRRWGARDAVSRAGLFHAVHGTQHFSGSLPISTDELEQLVGCEAMALIRLYVECDRNLVWPQFGHGRPVRYRALNSTVERQLSDTECADFCLLTMANELEICTRDARFRRRHGPMLRAVLMPMRDCVPAVAYQDAVRVVGHRPKLDERVLHGYWALRRRLGAWSPRRWFGRSRP